LLADQEELVDIEKMSYHIKLVSLTFPSMSRQAGMSPTSSETIRHASEELHQSNLVKLDLNDGRALYSKLVVIAYLSSSVIVYFYF
jgi:ubiquinone biosynthesis monooxygenase Coq6